MRLLVGLGNPGRRYEGQRHNVGFMALERIASAHPFEPWRKKFQGLAAGGTLDGARVVLLRPTTYMNESGRSVGAAMRFFKLRPPDLLVFHDELDLAPMKVRVKMGGGVAGHNGLRSIASHLGTKEFRRVRIGIGHPGDKARVTGYVLSDFAKAEKEPLGTLLDAIAEAAPLLFEASGSKFMNKVALAMQPPKVAKPPRPSKPAGPDRPS